MSAILDALRKRGRDQVLSPEEAQKEDGGRYLLGNRKPGRSDKSAAASRPSGLNANLFVFALVLLLTIPVSVVTAMWASRMMMAGPGQVQSVSQNQPSTDREKPAVPEIDQKLASVPATESSRSLTTDDNSQAADQGQVTSVVPQPSNGVPGNISNGQAQTVVAVPWVMYYPPNAGQQAPSGQQWPGYYTPPQSGAGPYSAGQPAPDQMARVMAPAQANGLVQQAVPERTEPVQKAPEPTPKPKQIVFDGVVGNQAILANSLYGVGDEVDGLVIAEIGSDYVAFEGTSMRARVR